ncbi:MAG: hypothetical protein HC930_01310 [Hydrococcus sp. SU_1_0]|nr:hypothetical protein [Hydrococcus sp. SU_1_0]
MKFKTITYQRVKNLGNYESERLEISAELDDDDNVSKAIAILKSHVHEELDIQKPVIDDSDVPWA